MSTAQQPVYRFTLASWLSIYGRDHLHDFVKESDYAALEMENQELRAEVTRLKAWQNRGEYAERFNEELKADRARLDWLADPKNDQGQISLPYAAVKAGHGDMRAAIDAAMQSEIVPKKK